MMNKPSNISLGFSLLPIGFLALALVLVIVVFGQPPHMALIFASAVAACIAMLAQRYCDSHGYTDGEVEVSLTLELADNPKRVGGIVIDLELPGDVPEARKDAIARLARLCPVHQTLENPPKINLEIL